MHVSSNHDFSAIAAPKNPELRGRTNLLVLAGRVGLDDTWSHGLPFSLLPLPNGSLLDHLQKLVSPIVDGQALLVANEKAKAFKEHTSTQCPNGLQIRLETDRLPRGTAGCLKLCENDLSSGTTIIIGGAVWLEDDPTWMLEQHRAQGNALTVFCMAQEVRGDDDCETRLRPAGIYCCEPEVFKHIPNTGYVDLKEQLIPALQRAGQRVGAVRLRGQTQQVTDWSSYLHAITRALSHGPEGEYRQLAPAIWVGQDVEIASDARIVGPAFIGRGCKLDSGSVLMGPAFLADGCQLQRGAWVIRSIAPSRTTFFSGSSVSDSFIRQTALSDLRVGLDNPEPNALTPPASPNGVTASVKQAGKLSYSTMLAALAVMCGFVWTFSDNFASMWDTWQSKPDYSAGMLVPPAALYMLYTKRNIFSQLQISVSPLGIALFSVGLLMNLMGTYYLYGSISNAGMITCASGLVMTAIGWRGFRLLWQPFAILFLMMPLPNRIHDSIMLPLQDFGARISATLLEMIGVAVARTGHILVVSGKNVAVAEACNGLRMALAFLIVTCVVAYVINRPTWQKACIVLSSVPIALACNVVRIVGTAYLYNIGQDSLAQGFFHDGAGLMMMPLAMVIIVLELKLLSNLELPFTSDSQHTPTGESGTSLAAR